MKHLKVLVLALLAMFALSAVAAASALADPPDEYIETGAVTAKQVNIQKFKINAGTVECKKLEAAGKSKGTTFETTKLEYKECKAFGVAATVSFNGCQYLFGEPTDLEGEATDKLHSANITIKCPEKTTITVETAICKVTVPAQGPLGTVEGKNSGANLVLNAKVKAIEYTETGEKCPSIKKSPETLKNGEYTGEAEALNVTIN